MSEEHQAVVQAPTLSDTDATATSASTEEPPERHVVPVIAWVALVVLALGALAIPFVQDRSVLADDFDTPSSLRTWPDNGATLGYVDGSYQVSVLAQDAWTVAYHPLPRTLDGLTMSVSASVTSGDPAIVLSCIGRVTEAGSTIRVEDGYDFVLQGGDYAIMRGQDVISSGTASPHQGRLGLGCSVDDSGTATLTALVGDADPIEVTDPDAPDGFVGIGLGAYSKSPPATVMFDDLRVEAS